MFDKKIENKVINDVMKRATEDVDIATVPSPVVIESKAPDIRIKIGNCYNCGAPIYQGDGCNDFTCACKRFRE